MGHLLATPLREKNPVRQTLLAAAAAFVIGGIATGAVLSQAQQTSPPAHETDDGAPGPGRTGWAHRMMHQGMMHQRAFNRRAFALIYPQDDRQLAPADVDGTSWNEVVSDLEGQVLSERPARRGRPSHRMPATDNGTSTLLPSHADAALAALDRYFAQMADESDQGSEDD